MYHPDDPERENVSVPVHNNEVKIVYARKIVAILMRAMRDMRMIEELLMRNYKIELSRLEGEDGEGWFAEVPDLKGCCADGLSVEEALANLREAKKAWFQSVLEQGDIPEVPSGDPLSFRGYSGRFVVRLPQSLHARIANDEVG